MTTDYPTGPDVSTDFVPADPTNALGASTPTLVQSVTNLGDAVVAVQTELGNDPAGTYTDVAARLSALDVVDIGAVASTNVTNIQAALDAAETAGGGVVELPAGDVVIDAMLEIGNNVWLRGQGRDITTIQVEAGAAISTAAISTKDFATLTGTNAWFYSEGVTTGFMISDLAVDGNNKFPHANNANLGDGIRIYGKRYRLRDLRVYRNGGHGIYSECAAKGGQDGDAINNMPESIWDGFIECFDNGTADDDPGNPGTRLDSVTSTGDGIHYLGPHDGEMVGFIALRGNERFGFYNDFEPNTYSGGLDMLKSHIYANRCGGMMVKTNLVFGHILTESNFGPGLILGTSDGVVTNFSGESIESFNNFNGASVTVDPSTGGDGTLTTEAPTADDYEVNLRYGRANVSHLRIGVNDDNASGLYASYNNLLGTVAISGNNSWATATSGSAGRGVYVEGDRVEIGGGTIHTFDGVGGIGIEVGASDDNMQISAATWDCEQGMVWSGGGRGNIVFLRDRAPTAAPTGTSGISGINTPADTNFVFAQTNGGPGGELAQILSPMPGGAGTYTTVSRPAASDYPQGTMIFDITLDQPLWSDGTNWQDATGTPA